MQNWQLLQGRLTAAKWLSLGEPEVAREVLELESDPMYHEIAYAPGSDRTILRRRRWPASGIHSGFYELNEDMLSGGGDGDIQDILRDKKGLLALIRRIGIEKFEKYFLYGEDGCSAAEIAEAVGLKEDVVRRIISLVLTVGARSEFCRPVPAPAARGIRYHCIAVIEQDPRDAENLYFRFLTPHWARGRYLVDYERLEEWKRERRLNAGERRRLRQVLKRLELLNMRQDTLFQILSRITTEQTSFLRTREDWRRRPLSLRELARRIGVSPSTVSRAISNRSVVAPWGAEIPLKSLLTGQRVVMLSILSYWAAHGRVGRKVTDEELMRCLAQEAGITVSRRTVNECRRRLK